MKHQNTMLLTAENLYKAMGREAAIKELATWRLSSAKARNEMIDFVNYVADMAEGADR